jgi:MATE family multidrug resistance protein
MNRLLDAWKHTPTHRQVRALAIPMILSNLSVPMVALVDSAVVGHLPHAHQLGAVAVGSMLYVVIAGLLNFLRMGTTGFAAQAAGRGDGEWLRRVLLQSVSLGLVLSLLAALLALPTTYLLLDLAQPSPELRSLAATFFHWRLLGLPAALMNYALIGWFLGAQNARAPLAVLLLTNVVNAVLSVLFVLGLDWGVVGAAQAAVIAEWLGVALALFLTRSELRRYPGRLDWRPLRRWQQWHPLLSVNRDIFIRSLALQLVFVGLTLQGSRLGDATVAANALLLNGLQVTAYALDGLAHAVEALCGRAIGARDRDALRRSMIVASGWSALVSLGFTVFFLLFGETFISMQTNIPDVRDVAFAYLPYLALLPLIAVASYLLDGLFIGATRAREMRDAMLLALAAALPLAWALQGLGNHGLWMSFLAFMLLRALTLAAFGWRISKGPGWA